MIITDIQELRKPNELATIEEAREIVKQLEEELSNSKIPGVGLSAPQIGIHKKVAIVRIMAEKSKFFLDLVNPEILDLRQSFINKGEGCLSLPGQFVDTRRYKEVFIKDDIHPNGFVLTGFPAVVAQHEFDHINQILMIDRAVGKGKIGRNDPCPCGKKKNGQPIKFKRCHGKV